MIVCTWNVRGLNDPNKVVEVRRLLETNKISVIALLETRVKENKASKIQNKLGSCWKWEMNYSYSPKGRIWIGWRHSDVTFTMGLKTDQVIHGDLAAKDGNFTAQFTAVYGLHTIDHRRPLWTTLTQIGPRVIYPWFFMGDFNSVLHAGDRIHGSQVSDTETRDFDSCIDATGLIELKSCGNFFSWNNKGQGDLRIHSRIDWAFGCGNWHTSYPEVCVDYLNPGLSDHSPLLLDCKVVRQRGSRPFKFFNYMAEHPKFHQIVQEGWGSVVNGTPMFQVWHKLKVIKQGLKTLHRKEFARLEERIDGIRRELDDTQSQLAASPSDIDLQLTEKECTGKLKKFLSIHEGALKQKSRIQWLKTGDSNTKFFFTAVKERYARNSIDVIYDANGRKLTTAAEIKDEIKAFYHGLIGSAADTLEGIDVTVVRQGKQLSAASPQFRPIACCSIVYKLISKILTHRMQSIIGEVVNDSQAGFIPGRNIADNILLASELVKCYSRKYISPRCMIKVDLKKAYDSLEWPFLKSMMHELGFPDMFIRWVMECLGTISYSILVNGFPTLPIPAKKGLRQGDPMSPYLFALGMEYLSRCLAAMSSQKEFNYHPRCKKLKITHMMFADDLLMFARADLPSIITLFGAFTKFSKASGLSANLHKSEVYTAGVSDVASNQIATTIGIQKGVFPFKYLGVPLTTRKLSFSDCKPLIERTTARIKSWSARFLSYAGRLQLVKSVLFGMQLYWCQIFVMPKKVMKTIQSICRCFLWTGSDIGSKKAPVSWDHLCLPKSCGGWNLKDLTIWNKAAVLKHCWALSMKQDRLWVKWIHTYYVKQMDFWTMPIPSGLTWSLRKIWQYRDVLMQAGGVTQFVHNDKFKISKMYKHLQSGASHVHWKRITCNSKASPKGTFITWLALQNRLPTKDRLISWDIDISGECEFCLVHEEKLTHLFFECQYSKEIWSRVLTQMGMQRTIQTWDDEVRWAAVQSRSTKERAKLCSISFIETVYAVWIQRNSSVFNDHYDPIESVVSRILFCVACRV
ncbi:uncharacterized protein [Spinacia oleracea]|uniref:Reverse transcriptase domain-containing protein n=1 Tax=Spinacia oleracea TaxID=3562 RepID=A0ABM3QQY7_SPIOL|nr:uncharacterized protein LOC130461642 [Spinacia oleracea]